MFERSGVTGIFSLTIFGILVSLSGCSLKTNGNLTHAQEKARIVASHNIICDLMTTLAQDTVDLTCLIDASQDPHTFRPTPSQRKALDEAQLILYGGYQLEPKLIQLIEATETPASKIAIYEQAVTEPILAEHDHPEHSEGEHSEGEHLEGEHSEGEHSEGEHSEGEHSEGEHSEGEHSEGEHSEGEHSEGEHLEGEHSEGEHSEGEHSEHSAEVTPEAQPSRGDKRELEPDPHVWHNIENTVAMVELIQSILLQVNPFEAESYLQRSTAFTDQLWQLDAWIDEQIATIPEGQRILVTAHNSLNYYVQAYYLNDYLTLQGISSEASPTASEVTELVTEIREIGVPTIFVESTASDRIMKNVARGANIKLSEKKLYVDGLGETDSYIDMMVSNTCTIVDGLGGECTPFSNSK
ncbi:metal ABC transporter solute-binding protein, Zn/Mn family [Pleurocapsa sp. PCC 7319]|uniref:metal ABC transporter solute-binding protein, Zn/Mn family n=1 Tax=Pleurocapsa sp. PCC 7319 TaxID=118161 RepID=UPI00034CF812|nr:zinc ABC transporter substrate-binding protein [Pleurocapsa sp. PCC 7319]